MGHTLSIAGIESNLGHARQKHAVIMAQLLASVAEIARLEVDLRNAKRKPEDVRPLEHGGNPNCRHEWNGDPENNQMFCSECPARFDLMSDGMPGELFGANLGDRFPTFDPDVLSSLGDGSSAVGWESVRVGGFEAQQALPSDMYVEAAGHLKEMLCEADTDSRLVEAARTLRGEKDYPLSGLSVGVGATVEKAEEGHYL